MMSISPVKKSFAVLSSKVFFWQKCRKKTKRNQLTRVQWWR